MAELAGEGEQGTPKADPQDVKPSHKATAEEKKAASPKARSKAKRAAKPKNDKRAVSTVGGVDSAPAA